MDFNTLSKNIAIWLGTSKAFALSILLVVMWAMSGPFLGFSSTWQLVINTSTTVITFWFVFVIQNTQNRDTLALHKKLDEIIRATGDADDNLMGIENQL